VLDMGKHGRVYWILAEKSHRESGCGAEDEGGGCCFAGGSKEAVFPVVTLMSMPAYFAIIYDRLPATHSEGTDLPEYAGQGGDGQSPEGCTIVGMMVRWCWRKGAKGAQVHDTQKG